MRKLLSILLPVIILSACNNSEKTKSSEDQGKAGVQPGPAGPVDNTSVMANNVSIEYDECGQGDVTLLFVHGWGINKEYWEDQKKYFCDKYRVVAIDLPGFGKSGRNRTNWTFDQYTRDVYEFIRAKNLKNVILIGHSMSGDILLLMDTKYPESIIGIVGIDNLRKPGTKNTIGQNEEMESFFAMLDSNYAGTVESYTKDYLFLSSADPSKVNRVVNDIKNSDPAIAIKVLRSYADVSQREMDLMQQLNHKLYLVNSSEAITYIDSLKKYCRASAEVIEVNGTGHYPMIEKPAEFNAALEKVIRMIREK